MSPLTPESPVAQSRGRRGARGHAGRTFIGVLATVIVLQGGITACGGPAKEKTTETSWELPERPDPGIRDAAAGLMDGIGVRSAAEEELIRQCMTARGFRYIKAPDDTTPVKTAADYAISPQQAEERGYGLRAQLESTANAPRDANNDALSALPASRREKWQTAFSGGRAAPMVKVSVPEVGQMQTRDGGCIAKARRQLYGSLEQFLKLLTFQGNFAGQMEQRAARDPRVTALNGRWSACMTKRDHPGLAEPSKAAVRAGDTYRSRNAEDAFTFERAIAEADATCQQRLHYVPRRRLVEDLYLTAGMRKYEAEVTAVREMNRDAQERARRILSGRDR
ncbi:hypothetical protein ABZ380_15125 [Streptomyces sp. NPDC005901]|uniref:hypothetical protein n=1 Tax=Streptomyces sp. NPDC005901 TaxID=3157171 RepID=UPI0033DC01BA